MKKIIFSILFLISHSLLAQDVNEEEMLTMFVETLYQAEGTRIYTCGNRSDWNSIIDMGDGWQPDGFEGQTVQLIINPVPPLNTGLAIWFQDKSAYSFSIGNASEMVSGFVFHADMPNYVENFTYSSPNRTLYFHMQRAGDPILPNTTKIATVTCDPGAD